MPKRKHLDTSELEFLNWKIKKLKRKLRRARSRSKDKSDLQRHADSSEKEVEGLIDSPLSSEIEEIPLEVEAIENMSERNIISNLSGASQTEKTSLPEPTLAIEPITENETSTIENTTEANGLDKELLEILGVDPSAVIEYGPDIHSELSSRLQHIATLGLTKETRKELSDKYLVPANCVKIAAPLLNAEIKAAVTEVVVKRDRGIEARQKQLASAISGLAGILTKELESQDKNSSRLKQLMDVCRILCDIQHAESITRRNFAIFSLKKELKEHLVSTKIDKNLFGENLVETLKSAKAVSNASTELKTKPQQKPKPPVSNNLNWKGPAPARKPQSGNRGREAYPPLAPGPSVRFNRNTTHANSSKTSQHPSKQTRRR